jgi:hypothetical protein
VFGNGIAIIHSAKRRLPIIPNAKAPTHRLRSAHPDWSLIEGLRPCPPHHLTH